MYRDVRAHPEVIPPVGEDSLTVFVDDKGKLQQAESSSGAIAHTREMSSSTTSEQAGKFKSDLREHYKEELNRVGLEKGKRSKKDFDDAKGLIKSGALDSSFLKKILNYWELRDEVEDKFQAMVAAKRVSKDSTTGVSEW